VETGLGGHDREQKLRGKEWRGTIEEEMRFTLVPSKLRFSTSSAESTVSFHGKQIHTNDMN
jgi:hypothetical protein